MNVELERFVAEHDAYLKEDRGGVWPDPVVFPLDRVTGDIPDPMAFVHFDGTDFEAVDMSPMLWNSVFSNCTIRNSFFVKGDLRSVVITNTLFESCNLRRSFLHSAHLSNVRFVDCDLEGTAFIEASIEDVVFDGCRFGNTSFVLAEMTRVTLTRPEFTGPLQVEATGAFAQESDS